jgi:PknH-like extracellular domain
MGSRCTAALLVGLLAVTGCTRTVHEAGAPQVDVLGSMLASESELNTILKTTGLRPKTALRIPAKLDDGERASRPECVPVIGNAMDSVYRDSGYTNFRETQFADDAGNLEVDQAVAMFDTPAAARVLVAKTVGLWRQCAGDTLAITDGGSNKSYLYALAVPDRIDGVDVTHDSRPGYPGYGDRRAILAADNIVVDVRISGTEVTDDQVVQLAKTIGGRNSL